jgi:drug/metabolite transporter (DMT)-like permease
MGARDLGALLLLGALWGASFLFIEVAVPALGPVLLVDLRVLLAALALALCAVVVGRLPALRARWKEFLFLGA